MMDLRYPIGRFQREAIVTPGQREQWIREVAAAPGQLRKAVEGLTPEQLDTPYRPEGWTVRQVVHHVPESHMHVYIRCKWALTEPEPLIKPYDEALWAQLPDVRDTPVEVSLAMLDALHARWVILLRSLTEEQWGRAFRHPENGVVKLETALGLYAWHGRHHIAHITSLRERMGW